MEGNLGPQFHGTAADLHPGKHLVLPANASGAESNFAGMKTVGGRVESKAFSTTSEATAWNFANTAGYNNPGTRTSVLRVKPHPDQKPGLFHESKKKDYNAIPGEMVAPHYEIADRHDIRPGQQGTFPLNWNQFAKKGMSTSQDGFNHPTDENIDKGHAGGSLYKQSLKDTWGDLDDLDSPHQPDDPEQGRLFK